MVVQEWVFCVLMAIVGEQEEEIVIDSMVEQNY